MPRNRTACRTCGSDDTALLGPLPDVALFAGAQLAQPLPGGALHRCRRCSFVYRAPALTDAQYIALYASGRADVWEQHTEREDFRRVCREVGDVPLDVLDIGCYTGGLLALMPPGCRLHGVEPNPAAASMAAARGVRIVARHWDELGAGGAGYDIITACDVIEHVGNPLNFLTTMSQQLRPGGRLIVTTGNADAWPWRLTRSRFWYCYFPEHISFIGPRWLSRMAASAGLALQRVDRFSHSPLPGLAARARSLLKTCLRLCTPAPSGSRPPLLLGSGIADDHIFCVLHRS